jgi:hypothetical protein
MTKYLIEAVMAGREVGVCSLAVGRASWAATYDGEAEARDHYARLAADPLCLAALLIEWSGDGNDRPPLAHGNYSDRNCTIDATERVLAHGHRHWCSFNDGANKSFVAREWSEQTPPANPRSPGGGGSWGLKAPAMTSSRDVITHLPEAPWSQVNPGWLSAADIMMV